MAKAKAKPAKKANKAKAPAAKANNSKRGAGGRPSNYTPALADKLCELFAQGFTMRQVGETPGMPDKATIIRWLAKHEEFRDQYARAKEVLALVHADEIIDIVDDNRNDWVERENQRTGETYLALNEEAIARSRTRVEARKWLMAKQAPKVYGDKLQVGGDPQNPTPVGVVVIPAKKSAGHDDPE